MNIFFRSLINKNVPESQNNVKTVLEQYDINFNIEFKKFKHLNKNQKIHKDCFYKK